MTIHYQKNLDVGIKAAYLIQPSNTIDDTIRRTFGLLDRDIVQIPNLENTRGTYIILTPAGNVYRQVRTSLRDAKYTAFVNNDKTLAAVEIECRMHLDKSVLEIMVNAVINGPFNMNGLHEIDSERSQIPNIFLTNF